MIQATVLDLESLEASRLAELVASAGPCITLFLPPYRPGAQAKPTATVLKSNVKEAARQLTLRKIPEEAIRALLEPLEQLGQQELAGGSHWARAIYRGPGALWQFELLDPVNTQLTIGASFEIRPLLPEIHMPPKFYVLKLSRKRVALLQCGRLRIETVKLPKGTPETLEEATAFEPSDHDQENRSSAGTSVGSMPGVRFGTGTGREMLHVRVTEFYRAVDRGIAQLLHGSQAPLILSGVEEDAILYRSINTHPNLMQRSISGAAAPETDLLWQASAIVRSHCLERAADDLKQCRERVSPARFSTDPDAVLRAAAEGRVSRIYVDELARRPVAREWGEEDLLNLAAVETIRQGGLAFSLPPSAMPEGALVAAIFRY